MLLGFVSTPRTSIADVCKDASLNVRIAILARPDSALHIDRSDLFRDEVLVAASVKEDSTRSCISSPSPLPVSLAEIPLDTMALARAFTSKRTRLSDTAHLAPTRSASARIQSRRAVRRSQISAPMELISTTNMLAFNAPDIHTLSAQFSASEEESDATQTVMSSPPTSVEGSPVDSRSVSPEPNHLSSYFQVSRPTSNISSNRESGRHPSGSPAVPQRAPSHTKAAHKAIARQKSQSLKAPPESMPSARDSVESRARTHPFSRELEQLDEVAEGFGVRDGIMEEEEALMRQKGLIKFGVQDYIKEIESLYSAFNDNLTPVTPAWI